MVENTTISEPEAATAASAPEDQLLDDAAPTSAERSRWNERGASLVEYALLVALIALVCMSAIMMLGGETEGGDRGITTSASSIIDANG